MRGRIPKPNAIKVLEGNPGKRALPDQPNVLPGAPDPPDSVQSDPVALAEWNRILPQLLDLGLVAKIDAASLAGYCLLISMAHKASESIAKDGVLVVSPAGVKKNPACGLLLDALKGIKAFAVEFGLTPASRSRVSRADSANPDAMEDWLFDPEELDSGFTLPKMGPRTQ
jgi:P27 family predicted phage terminase small subunit